MLSTAGSDRSPGARPQRSRLAQAPDRRLPWPSSADWQRSYLSLASLTSLMPSRVRHSGGRMCRFVTVLAPLAGGEWRPPNGSGPRGGRLRPFGKLNCIGFRYRLPSPHAASANGITTYCRLTMSTSADRDHELITLRSLRRNDLVQNYRHGSVLAQQSDTHVLSATGSLPGQVTHAATDLTDREGARLVARAVMR